MSIRDNCLRNTSAALRDCLRREEDLNGRIEIKIALQYSFWKLWTPPKPIIVIRNLCPSGPTPTPTKNLTSP